MILKNIPVGHWANLRGISQKSTVVDAGACIGEFIDGIRRHRNPRIIAIEPNQENVKVLKTKNVEVLEAALVARGIPKEQAFYCNSGADAGSLTKRGNSKEYKVNTINLDDLFKICPKINLFKIDIEGSEEKLIRNMTQDDADRMDQICLEFHYHSPIKMIKKLKKLGYKHLMFSSRELYFYK